MRKFQKVCESAGLTPRPEDLEDLEADKLVWDASEVTITVDSKRRVSLPNAKPGNRYDLEFASDGKLIFTPLPTKARKISYVRKDGLILGVTDPPITWEETRQAMDEFP